MRRLSFSWRWFNKGQGDGMRRAAVTLLVAGGVVGCTSQQPQVTHHWVSQDKVAGSVYRSDVAFCSQGTGELDASSPEFAAYKKCMSERGYALVAAADVGQVGRD